MMPSDIGVIDVMIGLPRAHVQVQSETWRVWAHGAEKMTLRLQRSGSPTPPSARDEVLGLPEANPSHSFVRP